MGERSDIGTFSARVWGGWALGLVAGWIFLIMGLVYLVYTPDLWLATPTRDPLWTVFAWGLLTGGSAIVLASTVAAEMRYHYLRQRGGAGGQRQDDGHRYVMGIYELTLDDGRGSRRHALRRALLLLVVLALLVLAVLYLTGTPLPLDLGRVRALQRAAWVP